MKKLRMALGLGIVGLVAGLAPGCMPESVEVGVDSGGAAGETSGATAGAGGNGGGLSGSNAAGGRAGSTAAGRGGAAGVGGGGSSGRGGRAGSTSGGEGGADTNIGGGGSSGVTFGAHCDCSFDVDGTFECRMSLEEFAARVEIPTACDNDENLIRVRSYRDGTIGHEWQVGFENDYELVFDQDTFVHGSAFGYVSSLCDIDSQDREHEVGGVVAGSAHDAEVFAVCRVCGQPEDPIDEICPLCTPVPGELDGTVTEPLENFCSREYCPATVEEARARAITDCPEDPIPPETSIHTACGLIEVKRTYAGGLGSDAYWFDAESGVLVGAASSSDTPRGLCEAFEYRGGVVRSDDCEDEPEVCYSCDSIGGGGAPGNEAYEMCPPP
ncbi:MAG TPA: hypothetical protein VGK73_03180 [Polyangiaceae bacterium]